ncbi:hypothetical protein WNZ14_23520 [Hoeflea sp. AS60]|uniref:hypothetical protein n=1 Tax=Hoeflea sp. AS60 TaxID=3135780 RepID=UPI00317DE473
MQNARHTPDVVLVADLIADPNDNNFESNRDTEQSERDTVDTLITTIKELGRGITHYNGPQKLAENASQHKDDIVLSIYGGRNSRNRMALVPAVCEAFNLNFIGPDVYGRIIAQDKEVSKRLALDCGLQTPTWRIIRNEQDVMSLDKAAFPCVVKPLLEGSSIGISQANLVDNSESAARLAQELLASLEQPVLVEEFISGRETAFVAIESKGQTHWAYSEIVIGGAPDFFRGRLFDAEEKANPTPGRTVRNIDDELDPTDHENIKGLLRAFGRFGYCRIDGRHADGKFHFLEMTPDAWIDPKGQFAMAFTEKGWTYSDVIDAVLTSTD